MFPFDGVIMYTNNIQQRKNKKYGIAFTGLAIFQRLMSCELRIEALGNRFGEKYRGGEHTLFHIILPLAPNFDNNHKGNGLYE